MKRNGSDEVFYRFDLRTGRATKAAKRTLKLGTVVPALEGEFDVVTRAGKVRVKPVFQLLKERLDESYTPEQASAACGVHPDTIRKLARAVARARGTYTLRSGAA